MPGSPDLRDTYDLFISTRHQNCQAFEGCFDTTWQGVTPAEK
jgi:hypothetical protein